MVTVIDGACYTELLNYGIRNMNAYRKALNELNVFPVPDGDTGTNMVMTLWQGFEAVKDKELSLGECITAFASSSVHGARGNSGVIFSQFFKGVSEVLKNYKEADVATLAASLESGSKFAYSSVAQPVEGTMLTVMRDASAAVNRAMPLATVEELVEVYLTEAEASLKRTPDLLPILKKAGVVDSGACGVVRFFEGVKKYLKGEPIGEGSSAEGTGEKLQIVDFSLFNKDTQFVYGYCIEGLLQLQADESSFDI
ncbi:MAG: DAK2 domain-containing protein, partial [Clostridia bacterium]|nr:DAK2 domain-containing protein [Clostridia bacterium]